MAESVSRKATRLLREVFGLQSFRDGQLEAIEAVADGKDVVVKLTTAGGKSLCYQLPPLLCGPSSCCLIVSPMHALMIEQVKNLHFQFALAIPNRFSR